MFPSKAFETLPTSTFRRIGELASYQKKHLCAAKSPPRVGRSEEGMDLSFKLKLADGEHPLVHEAQVSKVALGIEVLNSKSHV